MLRRLLRQTSLAVCEISKRTMADKVLDVSAMRKPYHDKQGVFDLHHLSAQEPFAQFRAWFTEACSHPGIFEANAMSLATATKDGKPSVRMVLLKGYDDEGFKFYTNYESRKGQELADNPQACLMFYWEALKRYVRIEGQVSKLSTEESTEYFHSRPKSSQIGACVSPQSRVVESRQVLDQKNEELEEKYKAEDSVIPKPDYWGGFLVKPDKFEFWQGQTNRVHDRLVFRRPEEGEHIDPKMTLKVENGWLLERLAP
ncbi:pyridoxine-5'-phosphate oxidase [Lingula anatina]|uniref:pyridoxal 5'-phosphate synthase n=1 Tax=Lingula anatina TaxID=7574 RepID=A0A1S3KHA6_LINAN|nr:pyridoxine-5'-phosphate oxidase [Lingula anatina]|eukprot:XP_013421887.1 pyridoxine-5'-phosphate oxidase [Lingula anatina]